MVELSSVTVLSPLLVTNRWPAPRATAAGAENRYAAPLAVHAAWPEFDNTSVTAPLALST